MCVGPPHLETPLVRQIPLTEPTLAMRVIRRHGCNRWCRRADGADTADGSDAADGASATDGVDAADGSDATDAGDGGDVTDASACPETSPPGTTIVLNVDMSCSELPWFEQVFVTGPWNGWCGNCVPLSDPDGDMVYTTVSSSLGFYPRI